MNRFLLKTPFIRFLLPVVAGTLLADRFPDVPIGAFYVVGVFVLALSFVVKEDAQYRFRWIFGVGVGIIIFAFATTNLQLQKRRTAFNFPETETIYSGIVRDKPQEKPRSLACEIDLRYPSRKKVVIYFSPDSLSQALQPGSEVIFAATLRPFRNMGNPDDFDYARYMSVKGFSATAYVASDKWLPTGKIRHSPLTLARSLRLRIVDWYDVLRLDTDKKAFISALTLGYKYDLSGDIKQAFRASGTSHVLAVSGLHVVFVFIVINSMLWFLGTTGRKFVVRQVFVILILWLYAFITGGAPSVVRATIMFTVYCLGAVFHSRSLNYNTLAIAAFTILIFSPMSLFDVGFQLSFSAVVAIMFVFPKLLALYTPRNKVEKYFWELFSVSVAAQIGIFPLGLYYFGTFPSYFFITNLLVVPIVEAIFFLLLPVTALAHVVPSGVALFDILIGWIVAAFRFLIDVLIALVYFFESLPFSQLIASNIRAVQLFALMVFVFSTIRFLEKKRAYPLITALASMLVFVGSGLLFALKPQTDGIVIYNRPGRSEIMLHRKSSEIPIVINGSGVIPHPSKRIVKLSDNVYRNRQTDLRMNADYLILSNDNTFSINVLNRFFDAKMVILDSSLSRKSVNRLVRECRILDIPVHDVSQEKAFYINF